MISVVVLTKDEEADLPRCLQSLMWCDDIHVLDSGSVDRTLAIATMHGARTRLHPFESFGQQRNYALENLDIRHQWVLFLDADEAVTNSFYKVMVSAVSNAGGDVAGFYCCWKMMLEGRWLKRCDNFPKWQFRIVRQGYARFKDFGHGQKEDILKGAAHYLKEPYLHFGFSKGWHQWIERHNKYSTLEAQARLTMCPPFFDVFAKHQSTRNTALRCWLTKVPFWPVLRFIHAYLIRFGFTEGIPGLIYCANMGYYEFLIQIKMRELARKKRRDDSITEYLL